MMALVFLLSVLASLLRLSVAQCPISGCDALRSFSSVVGGTAARFADEPRLLWSYETHTPSGSGCVTNGAGESAVVICPMAHGQNVSVASFAATNGSLLWWLSLSSQAVLPLVSYDGQSVISDGRTLDWLARDGRSLAPPVTLYPTQGLLFDLTITLSTSIVTMLYRCGFISTYTVDGVPISGLWLNDTVAGVKGTFVPLANPVMNDTRLYVLTAFRAHSTDEGESHRERDPAINSLRLYAINVAEALDHKFTILWTFNLIINGAIPYLHTQDTYCNSLPPETQSINDTRDSTGSEKRSKSPPRMLGSPPGILTMVGGRILGAVSVESQSGRNISVNMSVRDLGETFSVISIGYSDGIPISFAWSNTDKEKWGTVSPQGNPPRTAEEGEGFWASVSLPGENRTLLEQLVKLDKPPVNSSSLFLSTSVSTPVTLLQLPTAAAASTEELLVFGTAGNVSSLARGGRGDWPHLVGVVGEGGGGGEGGTAPSVKWSVPLPHSEPAQGQISSLSLSSRTLFFFTTPRGVYAYQLTL